MRTSTSASSRCWPREGTMWTPCSPMRLGGSADEVIYEACQADGRTLITLDLDFANPLRFPPGSTEGIVVVRPPRPLLPAIRATLLSALGELKSRPLTG